ncbi:hypothetical protein [Aestuariibaculum suncheonense]|uniref:Uncharacterized protein n=1 Tax=Aestuariibaculum suncheonense TaxID=1028745 RepID=A0A8J6Q4P1_9FLAO|nr:hypothetical protein [Aestuariibaculum suncheonense]MBD0834397.1 hypothetical protein [Aestuariibaculum suncheonense]
MKTKHGFFALLIFLTFTLAFSFEGYSQPPKWAPAHGYNAKTRHIYFPDRNFYYDLQKQSYIYLSGDNWRVSAKLPSLYASFDLGRAAKIELDLNSDSPQRYNNDHLVKYKGKKFKGSPGNSQKNNSGKGNKKK